VILKPASRTPLSALMLGQIGLDAGLPPGVLNVVTGPGARSGGAGLPSSWARSPHRRDLHRRRIMQLASDGIKRISLELGGKSPSLIFADADLDQAVTASSPRSTSTPDRCAPPARILVQQEVHDEFVARWPSAPALAGWGTDDRATHMGPMISPIRWRRSKATSRVG
jgi:acyl-CoA reductase-like NAD-dependent aldehyde dehydrogenase